MSDLTTWVQQAQSGNSRAFAQLMEHNGPRVLAHCRYLSGSADDAYDLSQEVFVKAYFSLDALRDNAAFQGWLKRITVNHCITHIRRRKREPEVQPDGDAWEGSDSFTEPWDPKEVDAERDRELIDIVLGGMRDTLRVPLVMHDMDGYSYAEIAEELRIGLSAVKMRIHRSRQDFRTRFEALRSQAGLPPREGVLRRLGSAEQDHFLREAGTDSTTFGCQPTVTRTGDGLQP